MNKKKDLPAMPFYVGDWLKCPEVRSLSPDYRGLWFDLLCYMWESTERGVMIKSNGKIYNDTEITRMVGMDNQNSGTWLTILLENGVCQRREDGAIYSRRMVRDEEIRQTRITSGSKGGNPALLDKGKVKKVINQLSENENEIANDNVNKNSIKFKIPSIEEIMNYCKERNNSIIAEKFFDFYQAKGWMIGKNKIEDWKAAVRTWENHNVANTQLSSGTHLGQVMKSGKIKPY
jgi:hypothetical protein